MILGYLSWGWGRYFVASTLLLGKSQYHGILGRYREKPYGQPLEPSMRINTALSAAESISQFVVFTSGISGEKRENVLLHHALREP